MDSDDVRRQLCGLLRETDEVRELGHDLYGEELVEAFDRLYACVAGTG
jgi:hypothetical protein